MPCQNQFLWTRRLTELVKQVIVALQYVFQPEERGLSADAICDRSKMI
jgi:hypothetical protein